MPYEVSIFDPRTMGRLVSRMPPVRTFFRDTFFRHTETFPTKSVDVDFKKGNRALAPFVHPRMPGKTIPNRGYTTKTYTPPMLFPDKVTTVDDLLTRMAGENPYSGRTPADRAVEKLARDFSELDEMITRREEWMCAQALYTGVIPIIGEGISEEINFKFTNTETITAAANKWSKDTADPIADLKRWRKIVQKNGFVNCNICIMADDVAEAFTRNAKVMKMLYTEKYDIAVIKPRELINGTTYIGTINGLGLDIYTYTEWFLDDWSNPAAPQEKPLVPDGTVLLASTAAMYSRYYGAVTLGNKKTDNFATVEGVRVPKSWMEYNPDRRFLQLFSRPLPVPHEVDSWFVAKVL